MSDAARRAQQRQASPGDVAGRGAWLLGRVRIGALSWEQVGQAARLGDVAAANALRGHLHPRHAEALSKRSTDSRLLKDLRHAGWEAMARAACALAREGCRGSPEVDPWLDNAEAYVLAPCPEAYERARDKLPKLLEVLPDDVPLRARLCSQQLLELVGRSNLSRVVSGLETLGRRCTLDERDLPGHWLRSPERYPRSARFVEIVGPELIPWILGEDDPLRSRVAHTATLHSSDPSTPEK